MFRSCCSFEFFFSILHDHACAFSSLRYVKIKITLASGLNFLTPRSVFWGRAARLRLCLWTAGCGTWYALRADMQTTYSYARRRRETAHPGASTLRLVYCVFFGLRERPHKGVEIRAGNHVHPHCDSFERRERRAAQLVQRARIPEYVRYRSVSIATLYRIPLSIASVQSALPLFAWLEAHFTPW